MARLPIAAALLLALPGTAAFAQDRTQDQGQGNQTVTRAQQETEIQVRQPQPQVQVAPPPGGPVKAETQSGQANIQIRRAEANIQVETAEPQVVVEQAQEKPQVRIERMNRHEASLYDAGLDRQKLIGLDVVDQGGDDVGEVHDLVLAKSGSIESLVVQTSTGFLGMNERLVAVPFNTVRVGPDGDQVRLPLSAETLRDSPDFSYDGQRQVMLGPDEEREKRPSAGQPPAQGQQPGQGQ